MFSSSRARLCWLCNCICSMVVLRSGCVWPSLIAGPVLISVVVWRVKALISVSIRGKRCHKTTHVKRWSKTTNHKVTTHFLTGNKAKLIRYLCILQYITWLVG